MFWILKWLKKSLIDNSLPWIKRCLWWHLFKRCQIFFLLFDHCGCIISRVRNIWYFSPLVLSKWDYFCSVRFAQFVYFLMEVCLLFNFWMLKFTIMFFWRNIFLLYWGNERRKKTKYFAPRETLLTLITLVGFVLFMNG